MIIRLITFVALTLINSNVFPQSNEIVVLRNVTVIDGTGSPAQMNVNVVIQSGKISAITDKLPDNGRTIDFKGKTIIPLLTNVHAHLGMSKGYSRDQILKELKRYHAYGVGTVVSMGTDKPLIFPIRDESRAGKIPGAIVYTAGYGFRPPLGNRPQETGMENIYRPATPAEAVRDVKALVATKPDMIKMWVDDMGGTTEKIKPEVYHAVITEAHNHGIPVAAHLYYLADAHDLLDAGVDIFAHSVRDKPVDDALITKMKSKGTVYIPTLTRDAYEFIYGTKQEWIDDQFFQASLEDGVWQMITGEEYRNRILNHPRYQQNKEAYAMALKNLKTLFDAGVLVAMGTDSGAQPVRAQGFSEHLELQLMVDAGLTPLQAIAVATRNSSRVLKLDFQGILAIGMNADFIVLDDNPENNIKATQSIHAVWKDGIEVSGAVKK